jgi:ATP-dependent Clp protease ATP-binding subunit ClpC
MEDELHKRVIGQNVAIKSLSQAIRRTRAGLKDPKRPGGSFIFAGPSGVGKTELSRTLADFLFGDEDALIQLDMSEYMEKHTVSRLFGSLSLLFLDRSYARPAHQEVVVQRS